ncbi:hypothetical protein G3T14_03545 [Methylobacterium sp. BTF04]|uniref:hypothetical protein n=1 Tax=Methylobacterium sp. BTF04 TaxID=2708300 RepID=UPI0013D76AF7|nr:hypothetical protein [Methylobacterium sp. BTF04]NEU11202.1 hypothetical protein [Methylobacterium sp. BTF04]
MRLALIVLSAALVSGLGACNSDSPSGRGGVSDAFDTSNYRQSNDTNGTQTRRDVNRQYTQPSMPSIINRGN